MEYRLQAEHTLEDKLNITIENLNNILREVATKTLQRKCRRKINGCGQEQTPEQPWITNETKQSIKKRKE